jgi:hypothetical protein
MHAHSPLRSELRDQNSESTPINSGRLTRCLRCRVFQADSNRWAVRDPRVAQANYYFAHDSSGFSVLLRFAMRNLVVLFIHFIIIVARLLGLGGVRSIVAGQIETAPGL